MISGLFKLNKEIYTHSYDEYIPFLCFAGDWIIMEVKPGSYILPSGQLSWITDMKGFTYLMTTKHLLQNIKNMDGILAQRLKKVNKEIQTLKSSKNSKVNYLKLEQLYKIKKTVSNWKKEIK